MPATLKLANTFLRNQVIVGSVKMTSLRYGGVLGVSVLQLFKLSCFGSCCRWGFIQNCIQTKLSKTTPRTDPSGAESPAPFLGWSTDDANTKGCFKLYILNCTLVFCYKEMKETKWLIKFWLQLGNTDTWYTCTLNCNFLKKYFYK